MARFPFVSVSVIAAFSFSAAAGAEEKPPLLKDSPPAPEATPAAPRASSPGVVAQLAAVTPKYDPAAPKISAGPAPDLREIDKPRNTIIRLPSYVVQEDKPLVLKEREIETPKERLSRALRKQPGLHFGSFWIFRNDGVALMMLEEEERLERMKEMNDLLSLLPVAQQKQMKPEVDRAFLRNELPR